MTDEREDPDTWYRLLQEQLSILRGKMILLEHADDLMILAQKRGSRRGYYPRDEA